MTSNEIVDMCLGRYGLTHEQIATVVNRYRIISAGHWRRIWDTVTDDSIFYVSNPDPLVVANALEKELVRLAREARHE